MTETRWGARGMGVGYAPPSQKVREKRLRAADSPGQHLWTVTAAWACPDPERAFLGTVHLDAENLIIVAGPGCFKCEREYSRKLAKMPCTGSVADVQP